MRKPEITADVDPAAKLRARDDLDQLRTAIVALDRRPESALSPQIRGHC
ncbi:hypothetical protein AB0H00_07655 [Nocardia sp. NPDC023852]